MSYARISLHPDTEVPLAAHDHDGSFGPLVVFKAASDTIDLELLVPHDAPHAATWLRAAAEQLSDAAIRIERATAGAS